MPNTLLRRLIRIFAVMFIVIATAYADDTEIFFSKTLPYSPYATTGDIAPPNPNYPNILFVLCLLYTSPSPRDATLARMPSSA